MTARKYGENTRGRLQPGNPGKPKGARHRTTLAVENLLDGDATKLARKAIDMALAGDTTALRLCLERIAPPRRGRPIRIALPEVRSPTGVADALASVIAAMADGVLSPDEAAAVSAVLEGQRRALETLELDARLRVIEEQISNAEH
jgi:hypothetical protein